MKRFVAAFNPETRDWYVTDRLAPGGAPVPDGSIREAKEVAGKLNAHEEMLDALQEMTSTARRLPEMGMDGPFPLAWDKAMKLMAALTNTTGGEE